jgi:hypothetical protein
VLPDTNPPGPRGEQKSLPPEPSAAMESRTDKKREIALGLDPYYKLLAEQTQSVHWKGWATYGITRRRVDKRCGRAFHQAVQRAECIHFALDGIADTMIPEAVRRGCAGFFFPNYTNAELQYIALHPDILAKTTFYRNGRVVPTPRFFE